MIFQKEQKGAEKIFEEITGENFSQIMKDIKPQT